MKTLTMMAVAILLILCSHALSQIIRTNRMGRAEAIKIVSQLPRGMRHADAVGVLDHYGLRRESHGPAHHNTWFMFYDLADGDSLELGYMPPLRGTNDYEGFLAQLANSRLSEAYIRDSNNISVINITLTNAP